MIKYSLSVNDYLNVHNYLRKKNLSNNQLKSFSFWAGIILSICSVGATISILKFYELNQGMNFCELDWAIGFILTIVATIIINHKIERKFLYKKMFSTDGIFLSEHQLELLDNCIQLKSKGSESKYYYQDLLDIEIHNNLVLILVDKGAAISVPINAFENDELRDEFIAKIKNYIIT
jgi:hypothetical protein